MPNHHLNHLTALRQHLGGELGAAAPARTGSRQRRDDDAVVGVVDQATGDAMPTRLSTGLAPALGLRCERGGGFLNGGSEDGGWLELWLSWAKACFQRLDALTQLLNQRSLLNNQHTQPVQLVGGVFRRTSRHVLSDLLLRYTGRLLLGKGSWNSYQNSLC